MNLNKALDKKYESMSFRQLLEAPAAALAGISENDAKLLEQAFGIKTIADLAKNKPFRAALAIAWSAELEG